MVEVLEGRPQFPRGLRVYQGHLLRLSHNDKAGRRGEWRRLGQQRLKAQSVLSTEMHVDPQLRDGSTAHHRS